MAARKMTTPFGRLSPNILVEHDNGRWGFVGSVDGRLLYVQRSGRPPTQEQLETARDYGPTLAGLQSRSWETRAQAEAAAAAIGATISQVSPMSSDARKWEETAREKYYKAAEARVATSSRPFEADKPGPYVLSAEKNGTNFYISSSPGEPGTDILGNAKKYDTLAEALQAADRNNKDSAWKRSGFRWSVFRPHSLQPRGTVHREGTLYYRFPGVSGGSTIRQVQPLAGGLVALNTAAGRRLLGPTTKAVLARQIREAGARRVRL